VVTFAIVDWINSKMDKIIDNLTKDNPPLFT